MLDTTVYGASVTQWLIGIGGGVGVVIVLRLVQVLGIARLDQLARRTRAGVLNAVVHALAGTYLLTLVLVGVYVASMLVPFPERGRPIVGDVVAIGVLFQAGVWGARVVAAWLRGYRERELQQNPAAVTTMGALAFGAKVFIWVAVLLLALDNLGVNITALVAGLGVGGVAVALAVQNILGDLFASLSIVLDRPFVIGDFLAVDQHLGSVENIGLKTTRLRSLSGEQLVFSNSDLLKSRIQNYGRMFERRVVFPIGVTYQTPREHLQRIPGIIREAIEAQEKTRFDRSHFKEYGPYSLNFETVYYVLDRDYNLYMDIQQAINLRIHERFEEDGIEFAYPTQTILVQGSADPPATGGSGGRAGA